MELPIYKVTGGPATGRIATEYLGKLWLEGKTPTPLGNPGAHGLRYVGNGKVINENTDFVCVSFQEKIIHVPRR